MVVSSVNGYKYGGEAANPEKAMIKGSRGSEGFYYTNNGKATPNGSLLWLNSKGKYTDVCHESRFYPKVMEALRHRAYNVNSRPPTPIIDSTG